jgi:hypothetical protein
MEKNVVFHEKQFKQESLVSGFAQYPVVRIPHTLGFSYLKKEGV